MGLNDFISNLKGLFATDHNLHERIFWYILRDKLPIIQLWG